MSGLFPWETCSFLDGEGMEVEWICGGREDQGTGRSGGKGKCDQGVTYVKNKNLKKNNIGFKKEWQLLLTNELLF